MADYDTERMYLRDPSFRQFSADAIPLHVDAQDYAQTSPSQASTSPSQSNEGLDPSSHSSLNSKASPLSPTPMGKITEHTPWNLPRSTRVADESMYIKPSPDSPPALQQFCTPSTMEESSSSKPSKTPRDCQSLRRSLPSSSSERESQPKRRQSASGKPEDFAPAHDTGADVKQDEASQESKESKARMATKASHSVIERRYRENLNTRITQLDETLYSTRHPNPQGPTLEVNEVSAKAPGKSRKADVLNEAMRYVQHAELESKARMKEIEFLRQRVAALEKLVNCGDCALLKQFSGHQIHRPTDF